MKTYPNHGGKRTAAIGTTEYVDSFTLQLLHPRGSKVKAAKTKHHKRFRF